MSQEPQHEKAVRSIVQQCTLDRTACQVAMSRLFDVLQELMPDDEPPPNKFTEAVGDRVRSAREEAGFSQTQLGMLTFRRRATISNIETGKSEATLLTLVRIADALHKPLSYFLPAFIYDRMDHEKLTREEEELLVQFARITDKPLRRLAIEQVKHVADAQDEQFRELRDTPLDGPTPPDPDADDPPT